MLMRRGNREGAAREWNEVYAYWGDPSRVAQAWDFEAWHLFERGDDTVQRRRFWRRPTDADLQRLLASNERWDFGGYVTTTWVDEEIGPGDRATVVDGDVIEAAWLAVTGEPPSRRYAPQIERTAEIRGPADRAAGLR